jgi:fibronectin-binding autotransporter adhesin
VTIFRWTAGALGYEGVVQDGQDDVDGLDGANSIAVSPDGNHVYVASRDEDAVAIFWRNPSSGLLTYRGMVQDGVDGVDGLNGARSVVVDPNGSHVYAVGQWDDALAVFRRDASTGGLTFLEVHKDTDPGIDGLNTADGVAVSLDGRHVYVAGYDDDAVAAFARWLFVYLPVVLRN